MTVPDKQGNKIHMNILITEVFYVKQRDKKKPTGDRAWLQKKTI